MHSAEEDNGDSLIDFLLGAGFIIVTAWGGFKIVKAIGNYLEGDEVTEEELLDSQEKIEEELFNDEEKDIVACPSCGKEVDEEELKECPACEQLVCAECFDYKNNNYYVREEEELYLDFCKKCYLDGKQRCPICKKIVYTKELRTCSWCGDKYCKACDYRNFCSHRCWNADDDYYDYD